MLKLNDVELFKGDPVNIIGSQIASPENIISINVTEIMNGDLTLSMVCAISENNLKNLVVGNIVRCYKDTTKALRFSFEIYDIQYSIDHTITVKAEHLSSRLRYIYVEPIEYLPGFYHLSEVLSGKYTPAVGDGYFLINHTGASPIEIIVPNKRDWEDGKFSDDVKSIRDIMMGTEGSILDRFGGGKWEYTGDRRMTFNPETYKKENTHHIPIRYSNNMSDFKREIDMDNAKSNQVLFWKKEIGGVVEQVFVCDRRMDNVYPMQAAQLRDLSSLFETKPTKEQLLSAASSISTSPEVTTTCTIANYDDKNVECGNMLNVIFPEFGVNEEMRITETVYNVLTDRYDSIKLGTLKKTLSRTIAEIAGKTGTSVY